MTTVIKKLCVLEEEYSKEVMKVLQHEATKEKLQDDAMRTVAQVTAHRTYKHTNACTVARFHNCQTLFFLCVCRSAGMVGASREFGESGSISCQPFKLVPVSSRQTAAGAGQ
jgi:hypothetical protein